MVYSTRWDHYRAEQCKAEAERRAGPSELGYLYRFDRESYASADPWSDGDSWISIHVVELTAYRIRKLTPCGWRLDDPDRFVSRETTKRFALPTIEEAIESFVKRQERRISIMNARIAESEEAIRAVRPLRLRPAA